MLPAFYTCLIAVMCCQYLAVDAATTGGQSSTTCVCDGQEGRQTTVPATCSNYPNSCGTFVINGTCPIFAVPPSSGQECVVGIGSCGELSCGGCQSGYVCMEALNRDGYPGCYYPQCVDASLLATTGAVGSSTSVSSTAAESSPSESGASSASAAVVATSTSSTLLAQTSSNLSPTSTSSASTGSRLTTESGSISSDSTSSTSTGSTSTGDRSASTGSSSGTTTTTRATSTGSTGTVSVVSNLEGDSSDGSFLKLCLPLVCLCWFASVML